MLSYLSIAQPKIAGFNKFLSKNNWKLHFDRQLILNFSNSFVYLFPIFAQATALSKVFRGIFEVV